MRRAAAYAFSALALMTAVLLASCRPAGDGTPARSGTPAVPGAVASAGTQKLAVVATFTILADMVANVGGDRVEITTLVGPDSDAHVFSPTPADARAIAASSLVFVNGLGLEGWIDKLIAASGYRGPVVVASAGMQTIAADMSRDARTRHTHGEFDPHGWQSPVQAQRYVSNIADALVSADPPHADAYRARAASYIETLRQLDLQARQKLGAVPAADRRVISGHVSFGYFAQAYGVQFFSPRGMSTESEASAKEVALLSRQIRSERIRAVFVENISDRRLVEQLARESGATIGGVLFSDALSAKDPRARTYVDMMRHNVDEVARALAPPASAATAVN